MTQSTVSNSQINELSRFIYDKVDFRPTELQNPILVIFALKGLKPDKYRDNTIVTDETAKDVLKELRSRYKGLNFEEAPTSEEASVHEQAELILKSKRK